MKKTLLALFLAGLTSLSFGKTLATVDGVAIDSAVVDETVKTITATSKGQIPDSPQLRQSLLQRMVVRTVVTNEARRLKLDESAAYKNIIAQATADAERLGENKKPTFERDFAVFKENLLEQAYADYVLKNKPVTDKETKALYKEITKAYKGTQEVQLAEIVTQNDTDMQAVLSELRSGASFLDLVQKYSIDEVAKKNKGINGFVNLKDMEVAAPQLYAAIKNLNKGQYTQQPMVGNGVSVVFMVHDKRDAQIPAYESMKNNLKAQLQDERIQKNIADLMKKAKIQVNP